MNRQLHEQDESLWFLIAAPAIWAGHFLLCYSTVAIWCAKSGGNGQSFVTVRGAIAGYTLVALAGIAFVGWRGWRRHRSARAPLPQDADSPGSRRGFLGFAALLLSGLSAVAVGYAALPAAFFGDCR